MSPPPRRPSGARPPAWLEGLLGRLVPADLWTSIREDLRERFAAVDEEHGRSRAHRWYLCQMLATLSPSTLWAMWARARRSDRPAGGVAGWLGSVGADVRLALRRMAKVPGPTVAAVLMLALGVGGGTGVYGIHQAFGELTDAGLRKPERIRVAALRDSAGRLHTALPAEAAPDLLAALPDGAASLISPRSAVLRIGNEVVFRTVEGVTPGHFGLAGVPMALGRALGARDDADARVLVLSHDVWRDRLGGDPEVLGSVIHVDREPYTVVGVAAPGFRDLAFAAAWTPLDVRAVQEEAGVIAMVRIPERGDGGLPPLERRLESAVRAAGGPGGASADLRLVRIDDLSPPGERSAIGTFFAILGALSLLVLLAGSANVANLGTAQVLARQRELAVRLSLGASKGRLVRLVVTELLVLGLLAGGAAMAVVLGLTRLIPRWLPPSTADVATFQVRAGHLQVALALSVVAALLSALLPVLRTPRTDTVLRSGLGSARSGGPGRIQAGLVVVQVSMSVLLLAAAGLLVRSRSNLRTLQQGLRPGGTSVFTVAFPPGLFGPGDTDAFLREILPGIRTLPGVEAGAAVVPAPVVAAAGTDVSVPGRAVPAARARRLSVSSDYFRASGTRLLAGREPRAAAPDEAVVSADLAERLWPGGRALGRPLSVGEREVRVVGVAEAGVYGTTTPQPHVFLPLAGSEPRSLTLVLRAEVPPARLYPAVRRSVHRLDPDIPVGSLGTLEDLLDRAQLLRRAASGLAALLGGLAFIIGVVGLYAHFSHHVASRRRGIGIRAALGASQTHLVREVLTRGLGLAAAGIVLGGSAAVLAGGLLRSFLFGVGPADPGVLASVAALLVLTAAAAVVPPARRAAAVEPMAVLREE